MFIKATPIGGVGGAGQGLGRPVHRPSRAPLPMVELRLRRPRLTVQQRFETHDIFNQSPPYEDIDLFASDRALRDAVAANGAGAEAAALLDFGRHWGTAAMFDAARVANENTPKLKTLDAHGFRRDE